MNGFTPDDQVRIDIPDESDPDYDRYHGQEGMVTELLHDDASDITGDDHDDTIYRVEFKSGTTADFRWHDLRPPVDE